MNGLEAEQVLGIKPSIMSEERTKYHCSPRLDPMGLTDG